jgi:hypothetical protein
VLSRRVSLICKGLWAGGVQWGVRSFKHFKDTEPI